jgi:hypothetical protein
MNRRWDLFFVIVCKIKPLPSLMWFNVICNTGNIALAQSWAKRSKIPTSVTEINILLSYIAYNVYIQAWYTIYQYGNYHQYNFLIMIFPTPTYFKKWSLVPFKVLRDILEDQLVSNTSLNFGTYWICYKHMVYLIKYILIHLPKHMDYFHVSLSHPMRYAIVL